MTMYLRIGGIVPQLAAQPLHHVPRQPVPAHLIPTLHPLEQNAVGQLPVACTARS